MAASPIDNRNSGKQTKGRNVKTEQWEAGRGGDGVEVGETVSFEMEILARTKKSPSAIVSHTPRIKTH